MNGIIVVNKEKDYTSRDVVNIVGKHLGTKKIGHTGTLDPIAEGVLVLVVGKCTKLTDYLTSEYKESVIYPDGTYKFKVNYDDSKNVYKLYEETKKEVMKELKRELRPEFINRIDEIIVFHKLNKEHLGKIVDIMLKKKIFLLLRSQ